MCWSGQWQSSVLRRRIEEKGEKDEREITQSIKSNSLCVREREREIQSNQYENMYVFTICVVLYIVYLPVPHRQSPVEEKGSDSDSLPGLFDHRSNARFWW